MKGLEVSVLPPHRQIVNGATIRTSTQSANSDAEKYICQVFRQLEGMSLVLEYFGNYYSRMFLQSYQEGAFVICPD